MREANVIPAQILAEAGTSDPMELTKLGVIAARQERWKTALVLLAEAYRIFSSDPDYKEGANRAETDQDEPMTRVTMFSTYGLALAMSSPTRAAEGARFCEIAIQKEPSQAEHYANLARIWMAGRNRLKTIQAVDRGLKEVPKSRVLRAMRDELGWREKRPVGFLPREHPVNVTLGKMLHKRHSQESEEDEPGPGRPKT